MTSLDKRLTNLATFLTSINAGGGGLIIRARDKIRKLESNVNLTQEQAEALSAWACESKRKNGCTAWGPLFDDAMQVAHDVNNQLMERFK